jgi:hypothetical protein
MLGVEVSRRENNPFWQKKQEPHEMVKGTTTRPPGLNLLAAPTRFQVVAQHIARFHGWHQAAIEGQIGPAIGGGTHLS